MNNMRLKNMVEYLTMMVKDMAATKKLSPILSM